MPRALYDAAGSFGYDEALERALEDYCHNAPAAVREAFRLKYANGVYSDARGKEVATLERVSLAEAFQLHLMLERGPREGPFFKPKNSFQVF